MASLFGNGNKKGTTEATVGEVNNATGEIITIRESNPITIPDMSTVTEVKEVAGVNPPMLNFRDNPSWNGMKFLVVRVRLMNGMIDGRQTDYALIDGYIYPPSQSKPTEDQRVLVATGSDNIYERVVQSFAANALPIVGTLRYAGRARFLD